MILTARWRPGQAPPSIRRPAGKPRTIPGARLHRALHLVRTEASPLFSPRRNVSGRKAALADLDGDGVALLRQRISALHTAPAH